MAIVKLHLRDLVWKTWIIDELDLERALNEMQQTGYGFHSVVVVPGGLTRSRVLLIASRFEEPPDGHI